MEILMRSILPKSLGWLACLGLLALLACERTRDIDPPPYPSLLVLDGLIEAGRPWEVYLSYSQSYYEPQETGEVANGQVWLTGSDGDTMALPYAPALSTPFNPPTLAGYQGTQPLPQPGETYQIHAQAPGLDPVSATMTMPARPRWQAASWHDSVGINEGGSWVARFQITIIDPDPNQRNYFFIYAETQGDRAASMEWQTDDPAARFRSRWTQRDTTRNYRIFQEGFFISDEWFGDTIRTLDFFLPSGRIAYLSNFYPGWSITLYSVNEPLYRYFEAFQNQQAALNHPYTEPTPVYSNIEGGLGLWGGLVKDSIAFDW
jgi:hypothetical protein